MLRIQRGLLCAVVASGLCLAVTGCWEKEKTTEPTVSSDPLAGQKAALAEQRTQALKDHHQACFDAFLKHPANGFSRMGPTHPSITYPKSLQLPAGVDVLSAVPAGQPLPQGTTPWTVAKIELVSLLMKEKPGVYPAENVLSSFRRPATRPLDDFETQALGTLQNGEQVVVMETQGQVRMLGAIRARAECLKCHEQKKEGDLLGAFTYTINPVGKN